MTVLYYEVHDDKVIARLETWEDVKDYIRLVTSVEDKSRRFEVYEMHEDDTTLLGIRQELMASIKEGRVRLSKYAK